jgi:cell division protein FtsL
MYIAGTYSTYGIIFIIFTVMAVAIIGVIIYRTIYKSNANRVLRGEKTRRLIDPAQLLTIITVLILAITSLISVTKIGNLQTTISNLNNQINNQATSISLLRSQVSDLENSFEEYMDTQNLVNQYSYSVVDINDEGEVVYKIEFNLNQKEIAADVKLIVSDGDTETIFDVTSSSLNYDALVALEDGKDYDLYVLSDGITLIQQAIGSIEVRNDFSGRFEVMASGWGDDEGIEYYVEVRNTYVGSDDMLMESVTVEVYYDDVLVETIVDSDAVFTTEDFEMFNIVIENNDIVLDENFEEKFSLIIFIEDNSGNTYVNSDIFID